jgi:hypothetical protein
LFHANARAVSAAGAIAVEVAKADNALIVVSVRKETDHKVETVGIPAPVKPGIGHRVHKVNVQHVHRVSAPRVRKGRAVSVPRVNRVHRVNVQRVLQVNVRHVRRQSKLLWFNPYRQSRQSKLLWFNPYRQSRQSRLLWFNPYRQIRQSRPLWFKQRLRKCHQHQRLVRLRASRGDSKPCYWHRHVQSTADNIAVV